VRRHPTNRTSFQEDGEEFSLSSEERAGVRTVVNPTCFLEDEALRSGGFALMPNAAFALAFKLKLTLIGGESAA
jgi:hypothetical protein